MSRKSVLALFVLCALAEAARAAPPLIAAEQLHHGVGIEAAAMVAGGNSEFAVPRLGLTPLSQGVVLRDRNGLTSRMVIGLVLAVAEAMAESGPKSVSSTSYVSGDYIYTTTTTTYYSEAEKAEMRDSANKSIDSLFSSPYSDFELQLFSRDKFGMGDTSGYKTNFLVGSGKKIAFETGFGFGKADSIVDDGTGMPVTVKWKYFGMPFRVAAVAGPVRLGLSYEWNWLKYGVDDANRFVHTGDTGVSAVDATSHPWHLDASTLILGRVAVSAGMTAQQIQKTKYGYTLSAGILF